MNKSYYTYVLHCADNTLYCGYTDDIDRRLTAHNAGEGAKYTKARRPVSLAVFVAFDTKNDAMTCEWWFKHKLATSKKRELVQDGLEEAFWKWQKSRD